MLEAEKENVGRISTRQECGDAPPRCNLASVGCGCELRHTHSSPRLALPGLALCCPTLVPWLAAWFGFPRAAGTSGHAIVFPCPTPELRGELYSVVTSWPAAVEDATHMAG